MSFYKIWPGHFYPLGATYDGTGTNFSLFSEVAEKVELCLFDDSGEESRIKLPEMTAYCWHGYLPDVGPDQRYGFRVYGPWEPEKGLRCNPSKLLLDPYAKAVEGQIEWNQAVFPYNLDRPDSKNEEDSAQYVPKSIVINPFFDWEQDKPLTRPWEETIIYETHVKGLTMRNPNVPEELRGTYAGLSHPFTIEYIKKLGVTAVELLPVHQFIHQKHLVDQGLRNYWGYDSIGFLAPHNEYSSRGQRGQQVQEFKQMVKTLHEQDIEVILDVVYNHTAEGNHLGPMICFKGIDNRSYYRLDPDNPMQYEDYTGTGNSFNMRHSYVLQLIMDSLRYWVLEMHVDGFRFDLAYALARELHEVQRLSSFFDLIHQDPIVGQVKLIAEPWDLGEGGYQVGNFPPLWSEWNGKYRDTVRDFWRGQDCTLTEIAYRLTGSSDLYGSTGRRPFASINFVTCHDGFTLTDLVSYNTKHNEENHEDNRDGANNNRSWNCGVEGPTDKQEIIDLRNRQKRNFLATILLSQGIPMITGGDEMGRTQHGNNNAYCQDDETSWYDWESADQDLLGFTTRLIEFRRNHPVFKRRWWLKGAPLDEADEGSDILWLDSSGKEIARSVWDKTSAGLMAIFLNGSTMKNIDAFGEPITDDSFYIILNAGAEAVTFGLPEGKWGKTWEKVFATDEKAFAEETELFTEGAHILSEGRSVVVLKRRE